MMRKLPAVASLAMDGHDGSGKTTLAKLIAMKTGARYVKPFDGTLGDMIIWAWKNRRYEFLNSIALTAVEKTLKQNRDADALIFDRHWACIFTLVPQKYRRQWFPLPFTIICWADEKTTTSRLKSRGESQSKTRYWVNKYKMLARKYRVPLINTSRATISSTAKEILRLFEEFSPRNA